MSSESGTLTLKAEGTPNGNLYVCETCGSQFTVPGKHETPTQCPWGEFHV